ncbi:hypothetical protein CAOG_06190 [Capsaspora owczarzaki ATCC 30864]|uniref:Galactosylgalactosylxylosylprotein 3-beta-glucuronosyltransferase n=1 Tax=Capsaspora owczarzaki (strain ATCC 30864) TaxID=595528 RepID=A0A0D2VW73_CAPO3|nr:hypothetical protein CAOG_06190 [Capsaspora owczarzaki ATCC 30864]KJE95777.1 hypothetical protein CAOG_006190 [Capsaspora owczarzaki ATCC 30864]|eukprot:XP_004345780.2 hypothetical protein CAOG_06190 [Capsaspora owczarzaki ATCC 30864]
MLRRVAKLLHHLRLTRRAVLLTALLSCAVTAAACWMLMCRDGILPRPPAPGITILESGSVVTHGFVDLDGANAVPLRLIPPSEHAALRLQQRAAPDDGSGGAAAAGCMGEDAAEWSVSVAWNRAPQAAATRCPATLPVIYAITVVKDTPAMKADLVRLANTLRQVPALHWVVVDCASKPLARVSHVLRDSGMDGAYSHLAITGCSSDLIRQRSLAIGYIERELFRRPLRIAGGLVVDYKPYIAQDMPPVNRRCIQHATPSGVVFFADMEYVYSLALFREMRFTKHASVWPVGFADGLSYEGPVVDPDSRRIIAWRTTAEQTAVLPLPVVGFAMNIALVLSAKETLMWQSQLNPLRPLSDMVASCVNLNLTLLEPQARLGRDILVWNLLTEEPSLRYEPKSDLKRFEA